MEFRCSPVHLIGIFILISVIRPSYSLECYSCNVSTSTADVDGCVGIGSVRKCVGNSICLAATYEVKSGIVVTYTTMQTCFPDMAGKECDQFFKSQRDLQRTATITPVSTCYTCQSDNCNKAKLQEKNHGNTSNVGFMTSLASILSLFIAKLIVL